MTNIRRKKKNIILFVGNPVAVRRQIRENKKYLKPTYRLGVLLDKKSIEENTVTKLKETFDVIIETKFNDRTSIIESLKPYEDEIKAVTCRSESNIPVFIRTIPHIPYIKTPSTESLIWSIDKIEMRKRFRAYDKKITPKFAIVKDVKNTTLKDIEKKVGFPLIIKPTGLAGSRLVTIAFHKEELGTSLNKVFRSIRQVYKEVNGRGEPRVLVEQFLEGKLYSIECFVNSRGKIYFTPMVEVKTGYDIGYDDFFGYQQITPTVLSDNTIDEAHKIATSAIKALALRSSTAHVELLKTESGWKVIEVGPRVGGFRQDLYELAYGINTTINDVYIRIPKVPVIPKRRKGYAAAMKFFAKEEGVIKTLKGIKKSKELKSFKKITVNKKVGDRAKYAKNGGSSIFNILLFNKERPALLADIRRLEQMVKIEIIKASPEKKSTKKKVKK